MGIDPGFTTDKGETSLHIVSGIKPDEGTLNYWLCIIKTLSSI